MANLCTNIGVLIAFVSVVGIIYTLASKEWKRNSQVSSQPNAIGTNSYEGLWVRCYSPVPGTIQCDNYDNSILGLDAQLQAMRAMMCVATLFCMLSVFCTATILPCTNLNGRLKNHLARAAGVLLLVAGDLQGQRAMMVIATILGFLGIITALLGMDCISAMQGSKAKVWTGRSGGICMILAGGLTVAAVSWYAAGVIYEYNLQVIANANYVYEFGSALYVGWISGGLAALAGGLLLCCSCGGEDDEYESSKYTYGVPQPPQSRSSKGNARSAEYV